MLGVTTAACSSRALGCRAAGTVDFESLVGKTAIAVVVKQRKDNGREFNKVEELLPDTLDESGEPAA